MTTELAERRGRTAGRAMIGALALAGVAFVTVSLDVRALRPESVAGAFLPDVTPDRLANVRKITVITEADTLVIERGPDGWVMRDRGGFPVRDAQLAALGAAVSELALERRMTADPEKHDRLGLGDPEAGGRGAILQLEDEAGALLVDIVVGQSTQRGGVFVRRAGENQAWLAQGGIPPIRQISDWLDLKPVEIEPETILRVDVTPSEGRPYSVIRRAAEDGGGFGFAPPLSGVAPRAAFELGVVAARLAQLEPVDVAPQAAVSGTPIARVSLTRGDGVVIDSVLRADGDARWVTLSARAAPDNEEAAAAAARINDRAARWAYQLTDAQAETLAPPFDSLLPAPPPPPPPPAPPAP